LRISDCGLRIEPVFVRWRELRRGRRPTARPLDSLRSLGVTLLRQGYGGQAARAGGERRAAGKPAGEPSARRTTRGGRLTGRAASSPSPQPSPVKRNVPPGGEGTRRAQPSPFGLRRVSAALRQARRRNVAGVRHGASRGAGRRHKTAAADAIDLAVLDRYLDAA